MPELNFEIVGAEVPAFAAVPTLIFKLSITNVGAQAPVHSIALRCQIQITATARHYSPQTQARLLDIFDEPARWDKTLRNLLWTHISTVVPQFSGSTITDLAVPCTYDFEVVSTRYFDALEDGDIPLAFLFSGTIFYEGKAGRLQIGQIPWSKEASFRLPVALWREMIARYYPNTAWLRLHKDVFDRLYRYKAVNGLPTWEHVFTQLLQASSEEAQL